MANNRRCPNGHEYDAEIYGEKCPFCPGSDAYSAGNKTQVIGNQGAGYAPTAAPAYGYQQGNKTQIVGGGYGAPAQATQVVNTPGQAAPAGGETQVVGGGGSEGKTTISAHGDIKMPAHTRRVVGVLVTYDHNPAGDIHRINEGVNTIGRASTNSIPVTRDNEMSAEHFQITFRPVDNAYFVRDETSVNGTFVNGEVLPLNTTRLLNNYDVIKAGKTTFIFMAIPKID